MVKSKSRRRGCKPRRPTRAEIRRQKALQRFILVIVTVVILLLATARLGASGITVYNIVRFVVENSTYFLMFTVLTCLVGFKQLHKQTGLTGGFVMIIAGLLLEWHTYLFSLTVYCNKEVFSVTARLLHDDIINFKASKFVGGRMSGIILYRPMTSPFSNIGIFLIGVLFITLGLSLMNPWEACDIVEFFKKRS